MKQQTLLKLTAIGFTAMVLAGCKDTETASYKAEQALGAKDFESAYNIASSAIESGAGDKEMFRSKAIALLGLGEYEQAESTFLQAFACSNGFVDRTDIDNSYYMAVAQFKKGDHAAARSTLDSIIALRPKDDGAYYLRGKVELAMGERESALSDFDQTVTLAPDNYDRYVGIYEELHSRGYDTEASSYLEKAMSAGSKLSDYNKGVLEYYMGSYTDARNDLENARKKSDNENLTLYLGKTYEALGDDGYAMSIYEEFVRLNPGSGRIYDQLASCQIKKGDLEGALTTIEAGLSLGNGDGMQGLMFNRVVAYELSYDFKSAKKAMDEYLQLYPDDETAIRENVFLSSR
ncbi:MAG: tetratricopeptide repeat protein [Lachnospiraceae bacterium]|nr:tetratricopeptide repeat protein [Lachnospiraceae bacterium]